eukprot:g33006.t1
MTKQAASVMFLVARNLGDGLRLFLTAIVLQQAAGIDLPSCIIIIGILTIIYTFFGGMKAVVWNDCIQFVVYMIGGAIAGLLIVDALPGGWADFWSFAEQNDKLRVFDFDIDFTSTFTFWAGLIGGAMLTMGTHGTDQMMVQRYLCARSQQDAGRALILSGVVVCLQFTMFLLLGVALACFYSQVSPQTFDRGDEVLATFIVSEMPIGLMGLTLAAVFSAAMSTLSSSLNSSASATVNDLYLPWRKVAPESRHALVASRAFTVLFGVIQIVVGIAASRISRSVVNDALAIAGFTAGILLGIFALGVLTRRVRQSGAFEGLNRGRMPGCVVVVGYRGRIAFRKAYGYRRLVPQKEAMTVETVFDLASLTKPIATATSLMTLIEQGKVKLTDPVAKYVPEFAANGKEKITVLHLLTHQGGLIPDNSIRDYQRKRDEAMKLTLATKPVAAPGERFIYSDVGFIVLAELIRRVTGKSVHELSQARIFKPLGMTETGYLPRAELRKRAAVTQQREGRWMQGEVHDPRAYRLNGIAGHAGLFSTADDLAVYAQMMLGRGAYRGVRVLKPETVELMTRPVKVPRGLRALGWDSRSPYSSNRGDLLTPAAFGHGGFTGTAIWMDPGNDLFVIFLSNRVHPDGKGSVNRLAGRIATIAAAAIRKPGAQPAVEKPRTVLTGIDVLARDGFRQLKGRRVGLITNHTGIDRQGVSTIKRLHNAKDVKLVALFSPEHGIAGKLDIPRIGDTNDPASGLKVISLYGKTRTPTAESLQGIDTLVFDIQDIGARFYTYTSTMGNAMRAAAKHKLRFVVLDRPNPINGVDVQGPVLDAGEESFVGYHTLPVRHGMTVGELATMFNAEFKLQLDLQVIRLEGWKRKDFFDRTGLLWVNPSPNMRNLTQALLYPGIGLLETTNLSVGRGTDTPFEIVGAPWIDGRKLATALNAAELPGVRFVPIRFTPESSRYKGRTCSGVNIIITDRESFHPLRTGLEFARQLRSLFPRDWDTKSFNRLLSDRNTFSSVLAKKTVREIRADYHRELDAFRVRRDRFLIYK